MQKEETIIFTCPKCGDHGLRGDMFQSCAVSIDQAGAIWDDGDYSEAEIDTNALYCADCGQNITRDDINNLVAVK